MIIFNGATNYLSRYLTLKINSAGVDIQFQATLIHGLHLRDNIITGTMIECGEVLCGNTECSLGGLINLWDLGSTSGPTDKLVNSADSCLKNWTSEPYLPMLYQPSYEFQFYSTQQALTSEP